MTVSQLNTNEETGGTSKQSTRSNGRITLPMVC
jgi:hypothetical protein